MYIRSLDPCRGRPFACFVDRPSPVGSSTSHFPACWRWQPKGRTETGIAATGRTGFPPDDVQYESTFGPARRSPQSSREKVDGAVFGSLKILFEAMRPLVARERSTP